jgi:hypothetical protein
MAISFYLAPSSFTRDQYDETMSRLETAGAGSPEGRTYHVALDTNGNIQVFDIWESQEASEAFGATLGPILSDLGVDAGEPIVGTCAQRGRQLNQGPSSGLGSTESPIAPGPRSGTPGRRPKARGQSVRDSSGGRSCHTSAWTTSWVSSFAPSMMLFDLGGKMFGSLRSSVVSSMTEFGSMARGGIGARLRWNGFQFIERQCNSEPVTRDTSARLI